MNKAEINKAIAKILGFRACGIEVNGKPNQDAGWIYPARYRRMQCALPERNVPGFIGTIEKVLEMGECMFMNGKIKHDFYSEPTIKDIQEGELAKTKEKGEG